MDSMVVDLHSDFLSYLTFSSQHTPFDDESRTSPQQLTTGGVHVLVTVCYSPTTSSSVRDGTAQMKEYHRLLHDHSSFFLDPSSSMERQSGQVVLIPAVENCSCFALEEEPLDHVFKRFQRSFSSVLPLYASLTWNEENRFGGGSHTTVGLKEDGKALLDFLSGKVLAIDVSHASDQCARDIIEYIERKNLKFTLMASHSNFREVTDHVRNLPFDIASHIVRKGGVIGLTLVESFVGKNLSDFLRHIAYGIGHGFENHMALGGDFFSPTGMKQVWEKKNRYHFPGGDSAACYPSILSMIERHFSPTLARAVGEANAQKRLIDLYLISLKSYHDV